MLASWSYKQACLIWQVCLLVIISKRNMNVCVAAVKKLIQIYLWRTCWHYEFEITGSAFSWMTTMIRFLRDLKPILDLDLYSEHMAKERITGSKIDHNFSAQLTYTRVYTVPVRQHIHFKILLITYKSINDMAPKYLCELGSIRKSSQKLKSSGQILLQVPVSRLKSYGDCAFSVAGRY